MGVRVGEWQRRQIKEYAREALIVRQQIEKVRNDGCASWPWGIRFSRPRETWWECATACVLWTSMGDPRKYHAAAAYRKAMGLNLKERSSGTYQGQTAD